MDLLTKALLREFDDVINYTNQILYTQLVNYTEYLVILEMYIDVNQISDTRNSKSTNKYTFTLGGAITS